MRYGGLASIVLVGTASEQLPRQKTLRAVSVSAQTGVWFGPEITANGCMSAMALASARAVTSSIGLPVPGKYWMSSLRP